MEEAHWPGEALSKFRALYGLTETQLADLLGVKVGGLRAYGDHKDQRRTPKLGRAARFEIATAGQVKIEDWLPPAYQDMLAKHLRPRAAYKAADEGGPRMALKRAADIVISTRGATQFGHLLNEDTANQMREARFKGATVVMEDRIAKIKAEGKAARARRKPRKLSPEAELEVVRAYAGGSTLRELAALHNVSNPTILRIVKRHEAGA